MGVAVAVYVNKRRVAFGLLAGPKCATDDDGAEAAFEPVNTPLAQECPGHPEGTLSRAGGSVLSPGGRGRCPAVIQAGSI